MCNFIFKFYLLKVKREARMAILKAESIMFVFHIYYILKMATPEEIEIDLRYELKINDMILMINEKQTLIDCIASILGIEGDKLHEIICSYLRKCLDQFTLPRKLAYIRKDNTIIDDYKKYPELVNFCKITLEMVSQIYETKITQFSLNSNGFLSGLIINEKGYQEDIKLARIDNSYYEVKDNLEFSLGKHEPSSSSQSYKLYEAFDIEPLTNIQKKQEQILSKSYSILPGSPLIKKGISLTEERIMNSIVLDPVIPTHILSPNLQLNNNHQFDEISMENAVDEQEPLAKTLQESIKIQEQDLTQSLTIQKQLQFPSSPPQQPSTPINEDPNVSQEGPQTENNMFYGYYSNQIYYPPYMMGQTINRSESYNGNFNGNLSNSVSLSPGKGILRKQNSTLEINENERYTGRLKFFDEGKNYGFIIMDADESDIFVHCDDLQKAGINKEKLRTYKQSQGYIRFSFKVMSYFGKYRESRKAVDLIILEDELGMSALYT